MSEEKENSAKVNIDDLKKQKRSAIFFIVLCGLAIVSVVIFATLGWFSNNTKVSANIGSITAQGYNLSVYYHIVTGETISNESAEGYWKPLVSEDDLDFTQYILVPGTYCEFRIKLVNEGSGVLNIQKFGLDEATLDEENPITVEGKSFYLGSQLYIEHMPDSLNTEGVSYIYTEGVNPKTFLTVEGESPRILLYEEEEAEGIKLANGMSTVFRARITFNNLYDPEDPFNKDNNQNVYKNFSSESDLKKGSCKRRLYVEY